MYAVPFVILFSEIVGRICEFWAWIDKHTFRALSFAKGFQAAIQFSDTAVLACKIIANALINRQYGAEYKGKMRWNRLKY